MHAPKSSVYYLRYSNTTAITNVPVAHFHLTLLVYSAINNLLMHVQQMTNQ